MPVRILRDALPEAALRFLQAELGKGVLQVIGLCEIDYQGRAESSLSSGERIILLKPDGSLLVHTASRLKPVNWQPPGSAHAAAVEGGELVITSRRRNPEETVRIRMKEIHAVSCFRLRDDRELMLVGTEEDLARLLHVRPGLVEPGFRPWARERRGERGQMDVYGEDAAGRRVVIEVKRRQASMKEVEQLRRYVEKERQARAGPVRGVLVAPGITERAKRYLGELGLEFKRVEWERILPKAREARAAGQTTLGTFEAAPAMKKEAFRSPGPLRTAERAR